MIKTIFKKSALLSFLWSKYNNLKSHFISYPKSENGFDSIKRDKMIQYNKVRYYGAKSNFCYNPFGNLFFNSAGNVIACCRSHKYVLGTYPEQSIKDIWFCDKAEKMREHLRHNDLNMGCDYCKIQIDSNRFQSLPSIHSDEYATTKKGLFPSIMEMELHNTCNLQCIMCTGRVSSSIRKYRENMPPLTMPYDDEFVKQLDEFIPKLKHMYFYGGEPFLIDIYYKIWNRVIALKPQIKLFVLTNGTVINQRVRDIINKTDFSLGVSLDSLDKKLFESIRIGANFELVLKNLKTYRELVHTRIMISHTPMKINWEETPNIINFCNQNDFRINLSYMEKPRELALWSFSPEKLDEIYNFYNKISWNKTKYKATALYNIGVFNEWKGQVKYFYEKNLEIIRTFSSTNESFNDLKYKLVERIRVALSNNKYNLMSFETASAIFDEEIFSCQRSPVQIDALKQLIKFMSDEEIMHSEIASEVLSNPEKLHGHLKDMINEDQFWARYY